MRKHLGKHVGFGVIGLSAVLWLAMACDGSSDKDKALPNSDTGNTPGTDTGNTPGTDTGNTPVTDTGNTPGTVTATDTDTATDSSGDLPDSVFRTKTLRGFDIASVADNNVLKSVIDTSGANVIRLMFSYRPLVDKASPYDFNEEAFGHLRRVIDWCEANDVHVVIDPHTTPGTANASTMYPEDDFWADPAWQAHLMKLWVRIATEYKDRGDVIAGYDLLNEPAVPGDDLGIWNQLVADLVKAIRDVGDQHTIIVEACGRRAGNGAYIGRIASLDKLVLPDDDNLVVSPHFYSPFEFTHQGVDGNAVLSTGYPGTINGVAWNKAKISQEMQPIRDFQQRHPNVPIYIGEFSATRVSGADGEAYLRDLIEVMEAENWSWTYHAFREHDAWNPEMPYTDPLSNGPTTRSATAPRLLVLKEFYAKNN